MKILKFFINDKRASITVFTGIAIIVLLGFGALVTDLSLTYIKANQIQNAADAAALAAGQELPILNGGSVENIKTTALNYAEKNAITVQKENVKIIAVSETSKYYTKVRVEADNEVNYVLARIFGSSSNQIYRAATAGIVVPSGVKGLIPIGLKESSLRPPGTEVTLVVSSGSSETGDYGWVDLDGIMGGKDLEERLENGYDGEVKLEGILPIDSGLSANAIKKAYDTRFFGHETCTYLNHEDDCPRLVLLPIVRPTEKKDLEVVGFAAIFLDAREYQNDKELKGTFVGKVDFEGSVSDDEYDCTSIYKLRLIE